MSVRRDLSQRYISFCPHVRYLSEEKSGAGGLGGSSHGSRGHVSALHDRVPASRSRRYHGILCAIAFAIQIMTVDHYAARIDGAVVSCIQFTVCGVVCCIGALIWGQPTFGQLQEGLGALLYAGVLSCGVGYTLQIVGQKGLNPTVAALIMSLESVIATISGWIAYKIGF